MYSGGKGGRCVGLTTLPPSCADCLEIWVPRPSGTLRACPGQYRDCFTFYICLVMYLTALNHSLCILILSGHAAMAFYDSEMPDK